MTLNSHGLSKLWFSLSLAALCSSQSAFAGDHVVTSGQQIQAAIDAAASGDRILVHEGLYLEALDFRGKQLEIIGVAGAESASPTCDSCGVSFAMSSRIFIVKLRFLPNLAS